MTASMEQALLIRAIEASLEAGNAILEIYKRAFDVYYKEDASPLTEADLVSNATILSYLEPTGIPVISEETKQLDYSIRQTWSRCWIVDPLDGTKEFVKRRNEFTVNIALVEAGVPLFGVIYAPALQTLYYTNASKTQAYKLMITDSMTLKDELFQPQSRIYPSSPSNEVVTIVASRSHLNDDTIDFITTLKASYHVVDTISKGSSLKFCLIAEGEAHLYPRFAPTMEWDTAAGQAICEAVGLDVLDISTQASMLYNKETLLNPYFLVTKKTHTL